MRHPRPWRPPQRNIFPPRRKTDADPEPATREQEQEEVHEYGQGHAQHDPEQAAPAQAAPAASSPAEYDDPRLLAQAIPLAPVSAVGVAHGALPGLLARQVLLMSHARRP